MSFHDKLQMTFGQQNTEKEAHEMLSYAFEHGINTLDTAEMVRNNHSRYNPFL
ncbi:putative NADP-dependent oxidoreductase domain-containing protein [Helianthus annuus]|nr:putative NADP-dependent oxidoreductase domain-containing protein [Helianthus annuus]